MKNRNYKWMLRLQQRAGEPPVRTVHQILAQRRRQVRAAAHRARHVRSIQRDGDSGYRCWECHHIPLRPWEPVDPGDGWSCGCVDGTPEAADCVFRR